MVNVTMMGDVPTAIQLADDNGRIYEIHPLECVFVCQSHAEYNTKQMDYGQRLTPWRVLCWYDHDNCDDGISVVYDCCVIPHKVVEL